MHVRPCTSRDAQALAQAYIDSFKSAYRGILHAEDLNDVRLEPIEARIRRWLASGAIVLAGTHKRAGVVGLIAAGKSDETQPGFSAEIYAHAVIEDFQSRGLGRKLLAALAAELKTQQHASALIWLPSKNSATAYYQKLGAERLATRPMVLEGKHLEAVAYGWRDLSVLVAVSS